MFNEYSWKKEADNEKRILELQNKFKLGALKEECLTDEDRDELVMLYEKQNEYLRERLRMYKQEIGELLKN